MRKICYIAGVSLALLAMVSVTSFTTTSAHAAGTGCLPGVLKQRLAQIRQKFGPVTVISAHRRGARIAGTGRRSLHASCRAVDFHASRGNYGKVVAWLKQNHSGGVGTYSCGMHHIHIDNGPHVRFHNCVNASGTPVKRYAQGSRSKSRASRVATSTSQVRRRRVARKLPRERGPSTQRTSVASGESRSFSAQRHFTDSKINGG